MSISFDELFAIRLMLQDDFLDENKIIRELNAQLLFSGMSAELIPSYLKDFYAFFGIDISIDVINEAIKPNSTNLINSFFSTFNINQIPLSEEEEDDDSSLSSDENDTEPIPINPGQTLTLESLFSHILGGSTQNIQISSHNNVISALINLGTQSNQSDVVATLDETETDKLKRYKPETKLEEKCTICLSEQDTDSEVCQLPCNHTFHSECIDHYLKEYNYKCPVCRKEVGKAKYNI
jgi:hypothetical protein